MDQAQSATAHHVHQSATAHHVHDASAWPLLSVIVPVFNEAPVIDAFHARTAAVLAAMPLRYEILFVNDGSTDDTLACLRALGAVSDHITVLNLSRNFGKEIAVSAGLDHAHGDAVVIIDADLQDPPEMIPALIAKWREGYDNVYAQRVTRLGETRIKRVTAHAFYRVINRLSDRPLPLDTGDFRLLSRRAVDALCQLRERHRFMKGLYGWVGYRQTGITYHQAPRHAGTSKWNYWKLWNFSLEGITSFSTLPLRLTSYVGLAAALLAVVYAVVVVVKTLIFGNPVAGYPSLIVIVLFLGGVQLLGIGIIGEYLGRVFNETKGRPLYFVESVIPSVAAAASVDARSPSAASPP